MNAIDCALFKGNVLIRLKSSCWSNSRKLAVCKKAVEAIMDEADKGKVDGSPEFEEERKKRLDEIGKKIKGQKTLIESKEYDALCSYVATAKVSLMSRYVVPSFLDDGLYLVRLESLPELEREIELTKKQIAEVLLPDLKRVYPEKVGEAKKLWNGLFRASEYPGVVEYDSGMGITAMRINTEALDSKFKLGFNYWQLTVPEGLPPEVREREEAKLRKSYEAAEAKITEMLYTGFQALVDHLAERLVQNEDGTKKTFQYTTFQNMVDFISTFKNKNVFSDERLASAVATAEDIIATVGTPGMKPEDMAKRIRDYDSVRNRTAEAFKALKLDVDKMVEDMPVRSFDFEE